MRTGLQLLQSCRVAALATALCGIASAAHAQVFTPAPCPAPAQAVPVQTICGSVAVPENRADPRSRTIAIAVLIARTPATDKAPDPFVFLTGGPSPSVVSTLAGLAAPGGALLLGNRDLITLDYRGLGLSTPSLDCAVKADGSLDAAACIPRLTRAGTDFTGYTTTEVAADVHDVLHALQLPAANLYGTSYGTHVALTIARDFPPDVRTMVLDGALPLQSRIDASLDLERAEAVRGLLAACSRNARCAAAFPALEARYERAIPRLNHAPLSVDGAPLTGDRLVLNAFAAQTNASQIPFVPRLIDEAARGTLTTLGRLRTGTGAGAGKGVAAQTLIGCSDSIVGGDAPASRALIGTSPLLSAVVHTLDLSYRVKCRAWPYARLPAAQRAPLVSALPTLIFNGEFDPTLPLPEAMKTAATLSHARIVTFAGYGHVALGNGACPVQIAQSFFDAPDPGAVDASCAAVQPQPRWVTREPGAGP